MSKESPAGVGTRLNPDAPPLRVSSLQTNADKGLKEVGPAGFNCRPDIWRFET